MVVLFAYLDFSFFNEVNETSWSIFDKENVFFEFYFALFLSALVPAGLTLGLKRLTLGYDDKVENRPEVKDISVLHLSILCYLGRIVIVKLGWHIFNANNFNTTPGMYPA